MKQKLISTFAWTLLTLTSFSQNFEKGYLINNDNTRIECEIDNKDWNNNPEHFDYRINNQIIVGNIRNVKSFEVYGFAHFERHEVNLNNSVSNTEKDAGYKSKSDTVFLKVLLAGNPSLLSYKSLKHEAFFYQTNDSNPIQLKYSEISYNDSRVYATYYKTQLVALLLNCNIAYEQINKIQYKTEPMIGIFKEINACRKVDFVQYTRTKQSYFRYYLFGRGGITANYFNIFRDKEQSYSGDFSYKSGLIPSFRAGLAFEIKSVAKLKTWSALADISYERFNQVSVLASGYKLYANIKNINLSLGVRKYLNTASNVSVFVGLYGKINVIQRGPKLSYKYISKVSKIESEVFTIDQFQAFFFDISAGVKYKRFALEALYTPPYGMLRSDAWKSKFSSMQLLASIKIF